MRGERVTLIVSIDALSRMSSNPFYPYMLQRIGEGLPQRAAARGWRMNERALARGSESKLIGARCVV